MKPVCFVQKVGAQWVAFHGIGQEKRYLAQGQEKVRVMFTAKAKGYDVKTIGGENGVR